VTHGAFDDAFRHSISKMSHLHFATNEESAGRLQQLGEQPERIHITGSPGLDLIRSTIVPSREEFFVSVRLAPKAHNLVVTFHPETLVLDTVGNLDELLAALDEFGSDVAILFTGSNADPEARRIEARIEAFVAGNASRRLVGSLGAERYFAALTYMDVVVGNSSSGLYEAPSFGIPTVNIGDRQTGRLKAASVIDCATDRSSILDAIKAALARGRKSTINPYGDGYAGERIVTELAKVSEARSLLAKRFHDLEVA
jgi:UDP-hydrolysing UDP-N-acetyl-D-glucosamine 2-epimerase